jgi:two-component system chemotaxis response regulator CheB
MAGRGTPAEVVVAIGVSAGGLEALKELAADLPDLPFAENGHRPAINALLRSVALDYGPRAVGVLLSGLLDDGVAGLAAIRDRGGVTIGGLLTQLAGREIKESELDPDGLPELENRIAMSKRFAPNVQPRDLGPPTTYTCPTCKGTLMAVAENAYRCPIGHAWTAEALFFARDEELEGAVCVALGILREKAKLFHQLAENTAEEPHKRYIALAGQAEHAIAVLAGGLSESEQDRWGRKPIKSS